MDLIQKIAILKEYKDLVYFKWWANRSRIAQDFILLSNLRFISIICNNGTVTFNTAVPVMLMNNGRPDIIMSDTGVLSIVDGNRKGITVLASCLKDNETAVPVKPCGSVRLNNAKVPKPISDRVISMCSSKLYPVSRIVMPSLFRISKTPEKMVPVFSTSMLKAIGASKTDSIERCTELFHKNMCKFGILNEHGFIIANEYIATGGCCVASSRGISNGKGSVVHTMPLEMFREELCNKHWNIDTGDKDVLE